MIKTGLLSALRKYRVRENSDPMENFVTEAFAWLLKTDFDFSKYFLMSLKKKHSDTRAGFTHANWSTQCNWDNKFPDMVCSIGESESEPEFVYVFEHKVWSHLHQNQLANYRAYADNYYKDRYQLILITAHRGQHDQDPDEALCWSDVYKRVAEYLETKGNRTGHENTPSIKFIFSDFLNLLEELGLAPIGAFNHGEIACYSSDFRYRMNLFWEAVASALSKSLLTGISPHSREQILDCQDFHIEKQPDRWGRIGLTLFRENRPSIFVGVVLDVADYFIKYSTNKGPDCSIMLWFDEGFHSDQTTPDYKKLTDHLSNIFDGSEEVEGWLAYDHLIDENTDRKNRYHPFYIRKPLVEIMPSVSSTDVSFEGQAIKMAERLRSPLLKTLGFNTTRKQEEIPSFLRYRNAPAIRSKVKLTNDLFLGRVMSQFYGKSLIDTTIWWDKDSSDWALCLKFLGQQIRPQTHLGLNLYKTDTGLDAWFFFDPDERKTTVGELLKLNNFLYFDSIDDDFNEHQLKAHKPLEGSTDSDAAVNVAAEFANECLHGLGYTEDCRS